jgi:hypothetical protein
MKKLIIIGSGRSVLNYKIGKNIDLFDIVVRFNGYQEGLGKYDEYAGTKTDIIFCNKTSMSKKYIKKYPLIYNNKILFILKRSSQKKHKDIISLILNHYSTSNIIHYKNIFRSIQINDKKVIIPDNIRNPTLGLMSVFYCLNKYKNYNIYIHGFDRIDKKIKNKKYMSHYYETFDNLNTKHNLTTETNTLKKLIKYEIIKKYI